MKKFLIFISIFTIAHSLTLNYFLSGDCYDYFTRTVKFFGNYSKNERRLIKVKVYWDDLLYLGCSSRVYPIREVKYV